MQFKPMTVSKSLKTNKLMISQIREARCLGGNSEDIFCQCCCRYNIYKQAVSNTQGKSAGMW